MVYVLIRVCNLLFSVSPFLMLAFLSLSVPFDKGSTDYGADKILGLHRAYRWVCCKDFIISKLMERSFQIVL